MQRQGPAFWFTDWPSASSEWECLKSQYVYAAKHFQDVTFVYQVRSATTHRKVTEAWQSILVTNKKVWQGAKCWKAHCFTKHRPTNMDSYDVICHSNVSLSFSCLRRVVAEWNLRWVVPDWLMAKIPFFKFNFSKKAIIFTNQNK